MKPLAGGLLTGKFAPDGTGPEGSRRTSFDFPVVDKPRAFACIKAMRLHCANRPGVAVGPAERFHRHHRGEDP
jgi:aryl-alcohol dehydrogenase-like predicted oxidoreductase